MSWFLSMLHAGAGFACVRATMWELCGGSGSVEV